MVSSIERFHCIQDSQLGPNGVLYREVPLYTGQPAGSNGVLYREVSLYTYVCALLPLPLPLPHTQVFFIDHNTKQTTFIDPRLPLSGEGVSLPVSLKAPEGEGEEEAAEQQVRLTDALMHTYIGWSTYVRIYVRMYKAHIQL